MSLFSNPFSPERDAALVTGAGNGIGRAIAQALVGEGVRTLFADIREDAVKDAIAASARPDLGWPWVGDLAEASACDALLQHAQSTLGLVTHFVLPRLDGRSITHWPWTKTPGDACVR